MTQTAIPEAVSRFLTDQIGSAARLDLLLFLHRHTMRWWAAEELAAELEMSVNTMQSHLEYLSARNLLDVRIAETLIYCYKPGREDLLWLVEDIAKLHYHDRDALFAVLARRASGSAQLFADAFQLRKDTRDDG